MSKKGTRIAFIIFISLLALIVILFSIGAFSMRPIDYDNDKTIVFEIPSGSGKGVIADKLKEAKLIRSSFVLKVYMSMSSPTLYAGTYKLSPSMSALEILDKIEKQDSLENETVTVTFIEGKRLSTYVNQIKEQFGFKEDDIYKVLSDTEFLNSLINDYWFITSDILNSELYYPLEGYIYPDTYEFKKTSTIKDIIIKTLDNMEQKLEQYKEEIELSSYSVHELITMASIVELEASDSTDRAKVAGVFYNRLSASWTLGSDVTTYYGAKKDFSEDLTYNELNGCNPYNTRGTCVKGLPVGPIASPSLSSIVASIEPEVHDYYYFVADKNKKVYFSKTGLEHDQITAKLKQEGNWVEY